MSKTKIQIGYGSDKPLSQKKGLYGTRSSGKLMLNGGFNGAPTEDFHNIPNQRFIEIFGTENLPKWKKELLVAGESLE
jgi:hypothetical protein